MEMRLEKKHTFVFYFHNQTSFLAEQIIIKVIYEVIFISDTWQVSY